MYNPARYQQNEYRGRRQQQPPMPMSVTTMQQWPLQQQLPLHETYYYSGSPVFMNAVSDAPSIEMAGGFVFPGQYIFSVPPPWVFPSQSQYWGQTYEKVWDRNSVAEPSATQHTFSPDAKEFIPNSQQAYDPPESHQLTSAGKRSADLPASDNSQYVRTQHQFQKNTKFNKHQQGGYNCNQEHQFSSACSGAQFDSHRNTNLGRYDQKRNQEHTNSKGMIQLKRDTNKVASKNPSLNNVPQRQTRVKDNSELPPQQSAKLISRSSHSKYEPQRDKDPESGHVILDRYNSDLYLTIARDGLSASTMTSPSGFRLLWGGARATHGACRGKVMFEVKIALYLDSRVDAGFSELHPNLVRVGWSVDSPNFALGEAGESYGYDGSGKRCYNGNFEDYGESFGQDDVIITALLDLDGPSATIAYMKNGRHLGIAHTLPRAAKGRKRVALFPHVSCKNAKVEVNFGKEAPWAHTPDGYTFIGRLPIGDRVRGLEPPKSKSYCEIIAMIGLPGCGKTTWALQKQKDCPHKRFNILGTDDFMERFKVHMNRSYSDRFEILYSKANACLTELLSIATQHARNYILDQTNLYPSARKKKMSPFHNFLRVAVVVQPEVSELESRASKRTSEIGKSVPPGDLMKMKANYVLPSESEEIFNRIIYVELEESSAQNVVKSFNRKGIHAW